MIFFVINGVLMSRGGIARRVAAMAGERVGRLPGSVAKVVGVAYIFCGGVHGAAMAG